MTLAMIDRLISFITYVEGLNIEPAGPSRSPDLHVTWESAELLKHLETEKRLVKLRRRDAAETRPWEEDYA